MEINTPQADTNQNWEDRAKFEKPATFGLAGGARGYNPREDIFHGVGTRVDATNIKTGAQLLKATNMDFDVRTEPLYLPNKSGEFHPIPNAFAITRQPSKFDAEYATGQPVKLGLCTERFNVVQNRDSVSHIDALVQAGIAKWEAAGVLKRGGRIWMAALLGEEKIRKQPTGELRGQDDTVKFYLFHVNGHDGKIKFTDFISGIRPFCANVLTRAEAEALASFAVRHTKNAAVKIEQMHAILAEKALEYGKELELFRAMAKVKAKPEIVERAFLETFPISKKRLKKAAEQGIENVDLSIRRQNQIEEMRLLMAEGEGNGGGTLWDWFNGVTEWLEHNGDRAKNFNSVLFGGKARIRARALAAAAKLVKVA